MAQTAITAFALGATAGWFTGFWMGIRPRKPPQGAYGLPTDHYWRRRFTHENTRRPSGPPPLRLRTSEPDEQFIRMDEGRIQCSTGNNLTTPKPKIIPRGQVSGSGVVRVKGTFEHGGRTYNYEADAKPTSEGV
jgi:hypothetical protein